VRTRVAVAALALSAAGLVGIALDEGFTERAVIPVPGDVPTIGFGTTRNADGSPVRMGDAITPPRALGRLLDDASTFERAVRRCAPVPMHPHEFDVWVGFTYNVGEGAFCRSTAARKLRAGDYAGACDEMLRWVNVDGRPVRGLVLRRERERAKCLGS
jgi:lysozyme